MASNIICPAMYNSDNGEFSGVCDLPKNHGGDHHYIDTMGMCTNNVDCRALRGGMWGSNEHTHNHAVSEGV